MGVRARALVLVLVLALVDMLELGLAAWTVVTTMLDVE